MDDDKKIPECYYCGDAPGRCDQYPKLEEDRYFSITRREDFAFQTVYNVCDIFLFKHASLSFCFDVYFFIINYYIPCYAKPHVCEFFKILDWRENDKKDVNITTIHAITVKVEIVNEPNITYFDCP